VGQFNNSFIVQNKTLYAPTLTIIVFVKYNQKIYLGLFYLNHLHENASDENASERILNEDYYSVE